MNWLIGTYPDAGKDWRQEEKGMTEEEMVAWHHQFNGHEFVQAVGIGDRQVSLECCSPWGRKELDMTEWPNWTDSIVLFLSVLNWSLVNQFCVIVHWYIFLSYDIIYFKISIHVAFFRQIKAPSFFLESHRKRICPLSLFHDTCKHHKGRQMIF